LIAPCFRGPVPARPVLTLVLYSVGSSFLLPYLAASFFQLDLKFARILHREFLRPRTDPESYLFAREGIDDGLLATFGR
jgi:hypothetical protein